MNEANGNMRDNMNAMQAYSSAGMAPQQQQSPQPVQNYLPQTPPQPQQFAGQAGWPQQQQPQQQPQQQQTQMQPPPQAYVPPQTQQSQPQFTQMQPQQQQYPNYAPDAGPNPLEQYAQGQIPANIPAPQLQIAGGPAEESAKKGRGRPAGSKSKDAGEELAFAHAIAGVFANPSVNPMTVTPQQLAYVGELARAAHQKVFGG